MLDELEKGNKLTGISDRIRDENDFLLCREKNVWLYSGTEYSITSSKTYPADDKNYGWARAYILAAPGYEKSDDIYGTPNKKDERQWAWYCIEEGNLEPNDLYTIAMGYQKYKDNEIKFSLIRDTATTTLSGNKVVYGPIKVNYSYGKITSGTKSDQWGGFDYAFFNGKNKLDDVTLCTLEGTTYKEIEKSAANNKNGYYEVRTNKYNNINLYIVTSNTGISNITLKVQNNQVDYTAKVHELNGTIDLKGGTLLCSDCNYKTTDEYKKAISDKTLLYKHDDNNYYKYSYSKTVTSGWTSKSADYNKLNLDGKSVNAELAGRESKTEYRFYGGTNYGTIGEAVASFENNCYTDYSNPNHPIYKDCKYNCEICGPREDKLCALTHARANTRTLYRWTITTYYFNSYVDECDNIASSGGKGILYCGHPCREGDNVSSQSLLLIEGTSKNETIDAAISVDIELSVSIKVTKKWDDADNALKLRPNNIGLNVYRSTDQNDWKNLTPGKDYTIEWSDKVGNDWIAYIKGLERRDESGNDYYFKVEEANVPVQYKVTYKSEAKTDGVIDGSSNKITITNKLKITNIDITKEWKDHNDAYDFRPGMIEFQIYRSTDQTNWYPLTENLDYIIEWISETGDDSVWKAKISRLLGVDERGKEYYYKVAESSTLAQYVPSYPNEGIAKYNPSSNENLNITIVNSLKKINIGGSVWLDGQTGIKPAVENDGKFDEKNETKLENITVYLYYKNPENNEVSKVAETKTDANGHYEFKDYEIGNYYVEFEYDGVHYEDTIKSKGGSSKAFEDETTRNTFNEKFMTINYKKTASGIDLEYKEDNKKSTLITNVEGSTKINDDFQMHAATTPQVYKDNVDDLNLGLVKRGTDLALSTNLHNAIVSINGQETNYDYDKNTNTITLPEVGRDKQTSDVVSYNLNLYSSDYNYRIEDYVKNRDNSFANEESTSIPEDFQSLKVSVIYKVNLNNQSTVKSRINEVKYVYDEKYNFVGLQGSSYSVQNSGNVLTINLNGLELKDGQTETLKLVFEVKETNNVVNLGDFSNKAEITSYSTGDGLIDIDSQPGNFINDNQIEDDNDTAGGLKIQLSEDDKERTITGKVFDGNNNVNGVIVQLIELKTVEETVYEYIWQETVSGTEKGKRLTADGKALEEYNYTKADGYYEFKGFIPGDYIVRFIYGDGTTYDLPNGEEGALTENIIKYNGQDYKSVADKNYKAEWYNSSSYTAGQSVARDNEARRLETMAYSVEINSVKGLLLKLLNNPTVDSLNKTEKEILVLTYNTLYDPDISEITADDITTLLKEQVLRNTWMCAETSKIKVAVDNGTETITNNGTPDGIPVKASYDNIDLGLELRPATKIELKKYITGFKLTAANGQTLVNAHVDVNEYLNGTMDSNKVQGIKDHVTILDNLWQYEVVPTDINTIIDGANLEFEYTLVVKNTGEDDYLSETLAEAYEEKTTSDYKKFLKEKAGHIKTAMRSKTNTYIDSDNEQQKWEIGDFIGTKYYAGGTGANKVLTEVTNIRDYVNNDLTFVFSYEGKVAVDETSSKTHRILRDDYSMQETTLTTVLKTTESTGKMSNTDSAVMYTVNLGKNPISSTGKLEFDTYIAEVMSYTNAAGRRSMTSTPGNAEIIDAEKRDGRTHEIDEADTGRIQISVATGEDQKTNYIIITTIIAGIALIAAGAFIVKKYVIK